MRVVCVLLLVGCGRLGFETSHDGASGGDGGRDGSMSDGPNNSDAMDITTTLGEDPLADVQGVTSDTYVSQASGATNNFGGADDIRIEEDNSERGLIRFDVSSIPTTATVLSAKIRFTVETATTATITFHEVQEAWDEGAADGTAGTASFTFRQSAIPWLSPGAAMPLSAGTALGSFSGAVLGDIDVLLPESLVQRWVSNPTANRGLMLESDSDSTVRLVSSEGNSGQRPVLSVTYE